jgi:signal transduction histidine kinase
MSHAAARHAEPDGRLKPVRAGSGDGRHLRADGIETRRLLPVLVPVVVAGWGLAVAALATFALGDTPTGEVAGFFALLAAAMTAEAFPVPIEGVAAGRTSLATIFIVGAAVEYGWAPAALVGFGTMFVVEAVRRRGPARIAYNASLYALAAGAAGAGAALSPGNDIPSLVAAALTGSASFYVVDIALLTAVVTRSRRQPYFAWWRRAMVSTVSPFAVMASLTVILVVLWSRSPFVAVALVGPLIAFALYQRRVHTALESLRELDRLKNEFIAVVSHELRTPIASVYGAALTLERKQLDERQRDSMLRVVYSESKRLVRLVDQVLWASRVDAAGLDPEIQACDAEQLAAAVVSAARTHLPTKLSVDLRVDDGLPPVAADPEKANQVLVNLVENAVKYSPNGGRIEVAVSRLDGHVRFAVSDEGLGIPEQDQERIFDKFERLDPELARGVGGTGLGLFISRELVAQMNGSLSVESREGQGSTFMVDLPVA